MTDYQKAVERQKDRLWPRIEALLSKLRKAITDDGKQIGQIDDMTDEEYKWSFVAHPVAVDADNVDRWHETDLGIDFTICESMVHDGEPTGINFRLDFQGDGGRTYRSVAPYNYTPQVWVPLDDEDAIDTRLSEVEENALEALNLAWDDHQTQLEKTANGT